MAVEWAIEFLESDPWCFRSGYYKERLLQVVQQAELRGDQAPRLQALVLRHVDTGDRMEFRYTIKLAKKLQNQRLVSELKSRLVSNDEAVSRRALWVLIGMRKVRFSDTEIVRARELVMAGAKDDDYHRATRWLDVAARRFRSHEWGCVLTETATTEGQDQEAALRVLTVLGCFDLNQQQKQTLAEIVMRVVDGEISSDVWFETMLSVA